MSKVALLAVAQHAAARGPALLVAFRLADHTNTRGWAWPSAVTLADETGYSRATVLRALQALEEAGELFVERSRNRAGNRYRLRLPGIPGGSIGEAADVLGTVAPCDRSEPENGRTMTPERSHRAPGTVAPRVPNHLNRRNQAMLRVGDTADRDRSCLDCHGSTWVYPHDAEPGDPPRRCRRCCP